MNRLPFHKQVEVVSLLTEGMSAAAASRITGVHRGTIQHLNVRIGQGCDRLHNQRVRNLQVAFIEIDETYAFIHTRQDHRREDDPDYYGDAYLWLALDRLSKMVISYYVGKRTSENAKVLLHDVRSRVLNQPQITTDGFLGYIDAVDEAFGPDVHYVRVTKEDNFRKDVHAGQPGLTRANTTFIERCNLTVRMQLRRHGRRTNAFSKTLEGHQAAIALCFAFYHWCRVHETLRVTPAMEMGLTNHIWSVAELIEAAEMAPEPEPVVAVARRPPRLRVVQGGRQ